MVSVVVDADVSVHRVNVKLYFKSNINFLQKLAVEAKDQISVQLGNRFPRKQTVNVTSQWLPNLKLYQ